MLPGQSGDCDPNRLPNLAKQVSPWRPSGLGLFTESWWLDLNSGPVGIVCNVAAVNFTRHGQFPKTTFYSKLWRLELRLDRRSIFPSFMTREKSMIPRSQFFAARIILSRSWCFSFSLIRISQCVTWAGGGGVYKGRKINYWLVQGSVYFNPFGLVVHICGTLNFLFILMPLWWEFSSEDLFNFKHLS